MSRRLALGFGVGALALSACAKPAQATKPAPATRPPEAVSASGVALAPELGVTGSVAAALQRPWTDPLTIPLLSGASRTLRSCTDFFAVSKQVSDEIGDPDLQVLLVQAARCEALKAVQGGQPAVKSFLTGWTLDAAGWRTAAPALDFQESDDGADKIKQANARGGSAADLEAVAFTPKDAFHYEAAASGWTAEFTILARGLDLNGDGVEDLIVTRNVTLTGGTFRAMNYFVVTRTSAGGPMTVVRSFP